MIRYIFGRTDSGKSEYLHHLIKKNIEEKKEKLYLIVPEQYTLQAEMDLINDIDSDGIIDIEIMSFNRLCYHVLLDMGGIEEIEIDNLGKSMVLRSVLDKHHEELLVFDSISLKTGFIEKISTLISEFKRIGIRSEELSEKIDKRKGESIVDRKLKDISLIYDYFNKFMEKGYFDEEDKLLLTLDKLKKSELLKNSYIYLDGYDSFSSQEYLFIETMLEQALEITISLTIDIEGDERNDIFVPVVNTFDTLNKLASDKNIKTKKVVINRKEKKDDLEHLEKEFFSYPFKQYEDKPENIRIEICNNYYSEVEVVAKYIQNLIRNEGYRWSDISVISGGLDIYSSIIKRVFSEYKIPFFIDEKISIMNHPITKSILSSLSCLNSGFKYEDVFKFIKTGFSNVDEEIIEKLENYTIEYGIRGSKWFKDFEYGDDLEVLNEARKSFIEPFEIFKKKIKTKTKVGDITKALFEFLIDLNITEKLENWIENLKELKELDHVQESTQIWNTTLKIFDQLVELEGEDLKTIKEYLRILDAGFSEVKLGVIPPALDQVLIGNIERSKSKKVKTTFIIGLNDGVIPKLIGNEGLIQDDEKILLKEEGIDLNTDSISIMSRDKFSTYVAFSKCSEKLFLSYVLSDNEGKSLRPSVYIDRFVKVFPRIMINSHMIKDYSLKNIYNENILFDELTENLRMYVDEYNIDEDWFKVLSWYEKNDNWKNKVTSIKEALFYDNQVDKIDKKSAKELYDLPLKSSVSRLENYSKCPFAHFVKYGLRLKDRKKYEIDLPDLGLLFHKTVEVFDIKIAEDNKSWKSIEEDECYDYVEKIVEELVMDYGHKIFESSNRYKYLIKKLKRVGKRAVWTLVNQVKQGEFLPFAHEIAFSSKGYEKSVPPIIIELSNGETVMLEGRIDRIDLYELNNKKYVKIIDYKSGSKEFKLSDVYNGLQLQLIVYLDAILENSQYFRVDELYPAGVFYFKIDDPMLESEVLKGDQTTDAILKVLKMDGLLLSDKDIAVAMDKNLLENNKSDIIPFEIKKDETISKKSKAVESETFLELIDYVKETISKLAVDIGDGIIKIEPIKNGTNTGCNYCEYKSICQFDVAFSNKYRNIKNFKDEEVIEMISKKGGE